MIVELATVESELAHYLEASRRPLDDDSRALLDEAQRSFVSYRSAECRARSERSVVADRSVSKLTCAWELTRRRTRELWSTYHEGANGGLPEPRAVSAAGAPLP
jgi:uncharacterized protein YecT (DUF1311 family)